MQQPTDALTQALQTAGLCLLIVLAMLLGAWLDRTNEAEELAAAQAHAERQAQHLQAVRDAYQQGLDDGAERARWLAERAPR
jgi:hypothetical protein